MVYTCKYTDVRHRTRYEGCRGVRDEIYSGGRIFGFHAHTYTHNHNRFFMEQPAATSIIPCLNGSKRKHRNTHGNQFIEYNNMEKTIIKPILQKMNVGEEREFPILKATSVSNTVSQRMIQERLDGKRYTVKRDWERRKVTVTRVS